MQWSRDGRCRPETAEGIEAVLAILAQSTVRALERHTHDPTERRRLAMRLTSWVLEGLDAVDGAGHRDAGGLRLDRARCQVHVLADNVVAQLTPAGAATLALLMEADGRVVAVETIAAAAGPVRQRVRSTPVDVQQIVHRLRRTLGRAGDRIVSQRGRGYALAAKAGDDPCLVAAGPNRGRSLGAASLRVVDRDAGAGRV